MHHGPFPGDPPPRSDAAGRSDAPDPDAPHPDAAGRSDAGLATAGAAVVDVATADHPDIAALREARSRNRLLVVVGASVASLSLPGRSSTNDWVALLQSAQRYISPSPWVAAMLSGLDAEVRISPATDSAIALKAAAGLVQDSLRGRREESTRWLERAFRRRTAQQHPLVAELIRLRSPLATTYYDDALDRAVEQEPVVTLDPRAVLAAVTGSQRPGVVHLLGIWRDPASVRLWALANDAAEDREPAWEQVIRALSDDGWTFLFVSLDDRAGADPNLLGVAGAVAATGTTPFWLCPAAQRDAPGGDLASVHPLCYGEDPRQAAALLAPVAAVAGEPEPAEETRIDNVARESADFVGRAALVREVGAALDAGRPVVLFGEMGVGKTRLAREVALARAQQTDHAVLWELAAEQDGSSQNDMAALGRRLGIAGSDVHDVWSAIVVRLSTTPRPWLFIFDNVESAAAVADYLAVDDPSLAVIVTTRRHDIPPDLPAVAIRVAPLAMDDAVELLGGGGDRSDVERPALETVAEGLGRLPRTLVMAREKLQLGASIDDIARLVTADDDLKSFYAGALESLSPDAAALLNFTVHLGPGAVPIGFLTDHANIAALPDSLKALANDAERRIASAMDEICSAGLADRTPDGFEIHRLNQRAFRALLDEVAGQALDDAATRFLLGVFPADSASPDRWPRCEAALAHAQAVGRALEGTQSTRNKAVLLNRCACFLFSRGTYEESADAFRHTADMLAEITGRDPHYATARSNYALSRLNAGHHEEACRVLMEVRDLLADLAAPSLQVATALNNLGCAYKRRDMPHEALRHFQLAREQLDAGRAPERALLAAVENNLGTVKTQTLAASTSADDDVNEAVDLLASALNRLNQAPHDDRLGRAVTLNNLGLAYSKAGRYRNAQTALEEALRLIDSVMPGDHPDKASVLTNLGNVLQEQGALDQALERHRRAHDIVAQFSMGNDMRLAGALTNLSGSYRRLGWHASAALAREQALAIYLTDTTDRNVQVPACHGAVGNIHRRLGDLDSAIRHHKEALAGEKLIYGEDHLELAGTYDNLGRALRHRGDLDEAIAAFTEALRLKTGRGRTGARDFARTLDDLGTAWRFRGNLQQALRHHRQALDIRWQHYSTGRREEDDAQNLRHTLVCLAVTCRSLGDSADGARYLAAAADLEQGRELAVRP